MKKALLPALVLLLAALPNQGAAGGESAGASLRGSVDQVLRQFLKFDVTTVRRPVLPHPLDHTEHEEDVEQRVRIGGFLDFSSSRGSGERGWKPPSLSVPLGGNSRDRCRPRLSLQRKELRFEMCFE